jgi:histidinol-phosphatase (PHP family)
MNTHLIDYHVHTAHSCDSTAAMRDQCAGALAAGITEIAFTEHWDPDPRDPWDCELDAEAYFRDIEACRAEFGPQGLTIRAGVEIGEPHRYWEEVGPWLDRYPFDLVIASVHFIPYGNLWEDEAYTYPDHVEQYFKEEVAMLGHGGFQILGHLDVVKKESAPGTFDPRRWEREIRAVLQACIDSGAAVDINAKGLFATPQEIYPSETVLRWYREMGGEKIALGSDSHQPADFARLRKSLALAKAVGFTESARFEARREIKPVPLP